MGNSQPTATEGQPSPNVLKAAIKAQIAAQKVADAVRDTEEQAKREANEIAMHDLMFRWMKIVVTYLEEYTKKHSQDIINCIQSSYGRLTLTLPLKESEQALKLIADKITYGKKPMGSWHFIIRSLDDASYKGHSAYKAWEGLSEAGKKHLGYPVEFRKLTIAGTDTYTVELQLVY